MTSDQTTHNEASAPGTPRHVLIAGGGLAGFTTARALRGHGFEGDITIVEPQGIPYDRPPLSKEILLGDGDITTIHLQDPSWFEENRVRIVENVVERLVPDEHSVVLGDGSELTADVVVIATGGIPRALPVPGGDLEGVHYLRTFEDAERLRSGLVPGRRLAVIGAGLIGAEVAAGARSRGVEVVLIDPAPVPLVPAVGPEIAEILHGMHAEHGIDVRTGVVSRIDRQEDGKLVLELDGGHVAGEPNLVVDEVLVGIGIEAESALAASASLDATDGVLVDAVGRTSHPSVFAAGDAARRRLPDDTLERRHEHWESAMHDGESVAAGILGLEPPAFGAPWFWSDRHGIHVEAVGSMTAGDHTVIRAKDGAPAVAFRLAPDGSMVGCVAVDDPMTVRAARRIIDRGLVIDAARLADPSVSLKKLGGGKQSATDGRAAASSPRPGEDQPEPAAVRRTAKADRESPADAMAGGPKGRPTGADTGRNEQAQARFIEEDADYPFKGKLVDAQTAYLVQQFCFEEAELLDDGRFADWLEILDDDLEYWAPVRTNRLRRQAALSIAKRGEAAFYDETRDSLAWRIRRFDSGMAWAEDPPSRTRHLVTNIVARHHSEDELLVRSAFLVYRSRLEHEVNTFAGTRTDLLRVQADGSFKVARRRILFDSNVLLAKNISTFF